MSQADSVYKTEAEIVSDVLAAWSARIPDIGVSRDRIVYIWTEVFANTGTNFFLGLQLLHDDIFIQTMSTLALQRKGSELGRSQKGGLLSAGEVTFNGAGGTFISTGSQVGAPQPAIGDTLVFETTDDVTIPNPGNPAAPTTADSGAAGNPSGTLEYAITFVTDGGETVVGAVSAALSVASKKVNLSVIPIGGSGTTERKIYRRVNGGDWKFVHTLVDNVTVVYQDNIADGALGGSPPSESTAERITVTAQAMQTGVEYDVSVGAISVLVDVEGDVTDVTNADPFIGGKDPESVEAFRQALLEWKRSPQSGSAQDLVAWATSIDGIDSAAVFKNVNLAGSHELGSVVVRVSGPDGAIPTGDLVDEVQALIESRDLANITIYVGTFTPLLVDVTVHVTPLPDYILADIDQSVEQAIANYVNDVEVGGVVYTAAIITAVFVLPGVRTLRVTLPADDVSATATQKPVAGTIVVLEDAWS